MAEGYTLSKFGKVYILRHGNQMVTVPPKMYQNGTLELHDPVLTTEEGEAYLIREHDGQITFELIPMGTISQAETKDPSVPSQPPTTITEPGKEDHLVVKDNGNTDNPNGTHARNYATENTPDKTVDCTDFLHASSTQQKEKIGHALQSNVQKVDDTVGTCDTAGQTIATKRGKVKIVMVNESYPDVEEYTTRNGQIAQHGVLQGESDGSLEEVTSIRADEKLQQNGKAASKESTLEMEFANNDKVDRHRLCTDRSEDQKSGDERQKSDGERWMTDDERQKSGGERRKSGGERPKSVDERPKSDDGQVPIDHGCSDEYVLDSEAPDSIKVYKVAGRDGNRSVSDSRERLDELEAGSDAALSMSSHLRDSSHEDNGRDLSDNSERLDELEMGSDAVASMRSQQRVVRDRVSSSSLLQMCKASVQTFKVSECYSNQRRIQDFTLGRATGDTIPGPVDSHQFGQCIDASHGARARDSARNATELAKMEDSHELDQCYECVFYIEMNELECMAMHWLFSMTALAEKLEHVTYDKSKGCMVCLGNDRKLEQMLRHACMKLRQERRAIKLEDCDECLLAPNVCEAVNKVNHRVWCHFIPEKSLIVIFAPDGKDVAAAEHNIFVELGRKPASSAEGGKGQSGVGQVPSSHPLSGMRYPPDMKEYQRGGLTVKVYTGNILQLPVECIVVSNQPSLRSAVGVANIVRKAAGKNFADECDRTAQALKGLMMGQCVMTSAGDLAHYKGIIHVYLPHAVYSKERKQLEVFEQSIVNCLQTADGKGLASVALPCIGTGMNGFTIEKCAQQYFGAIDRFSTTARAVSEVHFVDVKANHIRQVNATFEKHFRPK